MTPPHGQSGLHIFDLINSICRECDPDGVRPPYLDYGQDVC